MSTPCYEYTVSRSFLADDLGEQRTESSTPPRALSSPSTLSFLR